MTDFTERRNILSAVPERVDFEGLRYTSVTIMADRALEAGTAVLQLMPPDLFSAAEVSGRLLVCSAPGVEGGDITFRIGPQDNPGVRRPSVSVETTDRGVIIRGSAAGPLLMDGLEVKTTGEGTVNASYVHVARNIRFFPDRPDQVHLGEDVVAAGAIVCRTVAEPPQPPQA